MSRWPRQVCSWFPPAGQRGRLREDRAGIERVFAIILERKKVFAEVEGAVDIEAIRGAVVVE